MTTTKTIQTCSHCGSRDVYADAWVGCNDDSTLGPYDTFFCIDCDGECSLTEVEEKVP